MSFDSGGTQDRTATSTPAEVRSGDLMRRLLRLSETHTTDAALLRDAMRITAIELGSVFAQIKVPMRGSMLDDYWHTGAMDPNFWKRPAEALLTQTLSRGDQLVQRYRAKSGAFEIAILAVPLCDGSGQSAGAMVHVLELADDRAITSTMVELRGVAAMVGALLRAASPLAASPHVATEVSAVPASELRAMMIAGSASSATALAYAVTNQLRSKLGCDSVALGNVRGKRVQITSIAGFSDVSTRTQGAITIKNSMEECLDLGRPIALSVHQADGDACPLHRRWSADVEGACVASIPLRDGDRIVAVLALRHVPSKHFGEEDLKKIGETAAHYAAALRVASRAGRTLPAHAIEAAAATVRGLRHVRGALRAVAAMASVALLGWLIFGTTMHQVAAPAHLDAALVQHFSAPYTAPILASTVAAGDTVRIHDVLFSLDTAALELERGRLDASVTAAEVQVEAARAANDHAGVRLGEARADIERAAAKAVRRKIDEAVVRAPADGIILRGDLRRRVGATVAAGETLLEFVPRGALEIAIDIPERDVLQVSVGKRGQFRPSAQPDVVIPLRITRMRPSAEIRDGHNVFVADATIELDDSADGRELAAWMRCGVEGTARVDIGNAPVWWSVFHRAVDYVRLRLWL
ncbi:MAG: HlyD family efflux transporter periplasmic adaptor subunit [Phycisphaerae bacterium]|nr:HlyD family efflux transporter periplasmic adaptor subunit [Phycisphaerae bacterium]